jgi:hypothetical protein
MRELAGEMSPVSPRPSVHGTATSFVTQNRKRRSGSAVRQVSLFLEGPIQCCTARIAVFGVKALL